MRTFLYNMYKHRGLALLLLVLAVFIGTSMPAKANNIRIIGEPVLKNRDTSTTSVQIHFDVAWDHSWRTQRPNNWDAAWIFIKCWDGGNWHHVYLVDTQGSYRAGSKLYAERAWKDEPTEYFVSDRDGRSAEMDMTMEPAYSQGIRKWDPEDEFDTVVDTLCVGFFLYRAGYGAGDVQVPGVYVTWNYGTQLFQNEDDLTVKVFVVEMVYIPEGGFFLGGRYTRTDKGFYQQGSFTYNATGETTAEFDYPFKVNSEEYIVCEPTEEDTTLWAMPINGKASIKRGIIPDKFPKGFQAFYIMKYELTQQAWCEFLNCLNLEQQNARMDIDLMNASFNVGKKTLGPGYYYTGSAVTNVGATNPMYGLRYYVSIKQVEPYYLFGCNAKNAGNINVQDETGLIDWPHTDDFLKEPRIKERQSYNLDGQDVAMYFVSVYDLFAYAEFSGLRPMTELEYEKACRGNKQVAGQEFAWGSNELRFFGKAYLTSSSPSEEGTYRYASVLDLSTGIERTSNTRAFNCGYTRSCYRYWNTPAPLRVGCFADSVTTRVQAGATYWGVMNMSDNVAEICISVYSDELGRKFEGVHGCGELHYATGAIKQKEWNLPINANDRQYVIERGMCFQYSYYTGPGYNDNSWNYHQLWNQTTANHAAYASYWPFAAGMVSSRYRALNNGDQNLSQRDIMGIANTAPQTWTTAVNKPIMRGIRCVRTDKAVR